MSGPPALAQWTDVECCNLVTTGRRSGRRHEIEIWFAVDDEASGQPGRPAGGASARMYLISGNGPTADWFRNLQAHPVVTVKLDDEVHDGVARVVTDPDERERVGDLMGAKYVWGGDPAIGLTYEAWCYEVPAVAIEFEGERPR